jgi:ferredoxin
VCQRILGRKHEPYIKDMTVWYGAELYKEFLGDEYRFLSADEAVAMLKDFHREGLTPVAEFLMQSRKWMFVLCNCDCQVCAPTRIYNAVGLSLFPGPFIAVHEQERCVGVEKCGACVKRCHFSANRLSAGKALLDPARCLGCGLCVTTCQGQARTLKRREGYRGRLLPWEYVEKAEMPESGVRD